MDSKESLKKKFKSEEKEEDHGQYAMQIVSASVLPMVLKAAVELCALNIIEKSGAGAPLSSAQISAQLVNENQPETPSILDRILRLLASYSLLTGTLTTDDHDNHVHMVCGLASVATYFLSNREGGSLALLLELIQHKTMLSTWHPLKMQYLKEGFHLRKLMG